MPRHSTPGPSPRPAGPSSGHSAVAPFHSGPRRRRRSLLLGDQRLDRPRRPLEAGQSIDVPENASLILANDLTSDGTITMETAGPSPSYLDLDGHTLTNAGRFNVSAGNEYAIPATVPARSTTRGPSRSRAPSIRRVPTVTNSTGRLDRRDERLAFVRGTFTQAGGTNTGTPMSPDRLWSSPAAAQPPSRRNGMTVQGGPLEADQSIDVPFDGVARPGQRSDQRRHHHHGHRRTQSAVLSRSRWSHPDQRRDLLRRALATEYATSTTPAPSTTRERSR